MLPVDNQRLEEIAVEENVFSLDIMSINRRGDFYIVPSVVCCSFHIPAGCHETIRQIVILLLFKKLKSNGYYQLYTKRGFYVCLLYTLFSYLI